MIWFDKNNTYLKASNLMNNKISNKFDLSSKRQEKNPLEGLESHEDPKKKIVIATCERSKMLALGSHSLQRGPNFQLITFFERACFPQLVKYIRGKNMCFERKSFFFFPVTQQKMFPSNVLQELV